MPLQFTKMHGLGNDYVYISIFDQHVADPPNLARALSDRHRGIGSDGLILVAPPDVPNAHVRMLMFNADGTRGEMCGNGIRCLAKLAYERGLAHQNPLRVQTDRGVLTAQLTLDAADRVQQIRVDMDEPILEPARIPVAVAGESAVRIPVPLLPAAAGPADTTHRTLPQVLIMTAVSMGSPHAVTFVPDVARIPLPAWGPLLERHPLFPARMNIHFAQVLARDCVRMITWERGSGITQACGTGASAVCVAGVLENVCARRITAQLPGGELEIEWDAATKHVFMTGPAAEVFAGQWPT